MESKKIKGQEIKSEIVTSLEQKIMRLQNKCLSQENKILNLQQKNLKFQSENLRLKAQGGVVEIRGLDDKHDNPPFDLSSMSEDDREALAEYMKQLLEKHKYPKNKKPHNQALHLTPKIRRK